MAASGRTHAWVERIKAQAAGRPALMLFMANLLAQGLALLTAPILARLYEPQAFGILGALTSVVAILAPAMTGRYDLAMARAPSQRQAFDLLRLCAWWILGMGVLTTAGLMAWRYGFGAPALGAAAEPAWVAWLRDWWWALPVGLMAVAIYDTLAAEASRRAAYAPLARSKLTQATLGQGSQLLMGWLALGPIGLVLGYIVSQCSGVTRLFVHLWPRHPGRSQPQEKSLRALAWQERRSPLWNSWSACLDALAKWVPQLAISLAWDARLGGYLFLADRVVGRPLMMISTALLPVFMGDFHKAAQAGPGHALRLALPSRYLSVLGRQSLMSLAWTVMVCVAAPWLTGPLFGTSWGAAVPYIQAVALLLAPLSALHAVRTHPGTGRQTGLAGGVGVAACRRCAGRYRAVPRPGSQRPGHPAGPGRSQLRPIAADRVGPMAGAEGVCCGRQCGHQACTLSVGRQPGRLRGRTKSVSYESSNCVHLYAGIHQTPAHPGGTVENGAQQKQPNLHPYETSRASP